MPWPKQTLQALTERVSTELETSLGEVDPRTRRHKLHALARVNAGAAWGLHGHIQWLVKQILPQTADMESLIFWGGLRGVVPLLAQVSFGTVLASGQPGRTFPSGEVVSGEIDYVVTTGGTAGADGTVTLSVVAQEVGSAGNAAPGVLLRLSGSVPGFSSSVKVLNISGGADDERVDDFRERVIFRWRNPPGQGTLLDYEAWAREATPAITRAWAYRNEMGENTVTVRVMTDYRAGGPFPDAESIRRVSEHVRSLMPATPELYVVAPLSQVCPVSVHLIPDTPALRQAVQQEVQDFFLSDPDNIPGGTIYVSRLSEVISKAAGEKAHHLLQPAMDVKLQPGAIGIPGDIQWR